MAKKIRKYKRKIRNKRKKRKYNKKRKYSSVYMFLLFLLLLVFIFLILWFTTNIFGNNPLLSLKDSNLELDKQTVLKISPKKIKNSLLTRKTFGKNELNFSSLDEENLSVFSSVFSSNFSDMKNNLVKNHKKHPFYKSELLKTNIPIVKNCPFAIHELDYKKPSKMKIFASNEDYDEDNYTEHSDYFNIRVFLI